MRLRPEEIFDGTSLRVPSGHRWQDRRGNDDDDEGGKDACEGLGDEVRDDEECDDEGRQVYGNTDEKFERDDEVDETTNEASSSDDDGTSDDARVDEDEDDDDEDDELVNDDDGSATAAIERGSASQPAESGTPITCDCM